MSRLGDDAASPGTEMVHLAHTATSVRAVMRAIGLPIVAFEAPYRQERAQQSTVRGGSGSTQVSD